MTKSDQELRDKLAIEYGKYNTVFEDEYSNDLRAFKAGWDAARANDDRASVLEHLHGQYRFRINAIEQERDQLRAELSARQKNSQQHADAANVLREEVKQIQEQILAERESFKQNLNWAYEQNDQLKAMAERLAGALHAEIEMIRKLDHKPLYRSVEALTEYRAMKKE